MAITNTQRKLETIIGIDFGTCFSGATYVLPGKTEVVDITKWPGRVPYLSSKYPTLCLFDKSSKDIIQWGHPAWKMSLQKKEGSILLQQFKLYLDEQLEPELNPLPMGLMITDVIASYLRNFVDFVKSEIKKKNNKDVDFENSTTFCLTVPAIWSDRPKQIMRDAAILSGIVSERNHNEKLVIISESAAAALYCENNCDTFNLRNGDEFMVCDAGGAILRAVTFEVGLNSASQKVFKEILKGEGRICGSTFIDKNFRKMLRSKVKKLLPRHSKIPEIPFQHMMEVFTGIIKPHFKGTTDEFLQIPMALNIPRDIRDSLEGILMFTKEELKGHVMDPIINQVVEECRKLKQKTSNLKAIFMVGGFGSSDYLYNHMQNEFSDEEIQIIQPSRPELAVVRGAALYGLSLRKITRHVSRLWYGIEITNIFDSTVDPIEYRVVRSDGSIRCDNMFSTLIALGQSIDNESCVSRNYNTYYPDNIACTIYCSDSKEEPRYTISTETITVRRLFDIEIPMPEIPGLRQGDRVLLTVEMYFGQTELRVESFICGKSHYVTCNYNIGE